MSHAALLDVRNDKRLSRFLTGCGERQQEQHNQSLLMKQPLEIDIQYINKHNILLFVVSVGNALIKNTYHR